MEKKTRKRKSKMRKTKKIREKIKPSNYPSMKAKDGDEMKWKAGERRDENFPFKKLNDHKREKFFQHHIATFSWYALTQFISINSHQLLLSNFPKN